MKRFAVLRKFVYSCILSYMFLHPIDGYNKSAILAQRKLFRLKYQMLRAQVKLVPRSNADRIIEIKGKFTGVVTDNSVLDTITVSSLVECAVFCRASDQCQSYFWNSLLSECQRQLTLYTTSVDLHEYRPGNTYFVSEDNLVKATGESLKDSLCKGAGYNMSDTGIMCYQIENRKQNYVTASRQCVNESGHLVRVDSTEKFDDIKAVMLGEEADFRLLVDGRYTSEGVWKFSDGSLMTILDFVLDQPDSSMQDDKDISKQNEEDSSNEDNEDCIVLVYNSGMVKMDDVSCDEQFTFICEIKLL